MLGVMRPTRCPLCKEAGMSISHILFNCETGGTGYSSAWNAQMGYLLISLNVAIREEILSLKRDEVNRLLSKLEEFNLSHVYRKVSNGADKLLE